jgi:ribose transport system substrate-binding protein
VRRSRAGALQAVREAKPNTPFIGSVSHEVNTYGARLIHLGLAMIKGDRIPPYNYVNHKLVTVKNIPESV